MPLTTLTLTYGEKSIPVASIEEASALYSADRDASGLGASRWPMGEIVGSDGLRLFVSYNGRVWAKNPCAWTGADRDVRPVYCPLVAV